MNQDSDRSSTDPHPVPVGQHLADVVERYTSGHYEALLGELLEGGSMEEYLAKKLHQAMDGLGTDEDAVLETLISSTGEEIAAIKRYFYRGDRTRA